MRTLNSWNRDHIVQAFSRLENQPWLLLPLAQKPPVSEVDPTSIRRERNIPFGSTLFGAAAVYHEGKGIEELVEMVLKLRYQPDWHFLFTVITDHNEKETKRCPLANASPSPWFEHIHIRQGEYCEWPWMCGLYRAIDVLLVNSRSDSWGRVITAAASFGDPVVCRRESDCGTNHVLPDLERFPISLVHTLSWRRSLRIPLVGRARWPRR